MTARSRNAGPGQQREDAANDENRAPLWRADDERDDVVSVAKPTKSIKKKRKKKRKKRTPLPDFDVLSLPKPDRKLDENLDLSLSSLYGCSYDELEMQNLGCKRLPKETAFYDDGRCHFVAGSDDGGPPADDPLLAQYLSHYKVQLPGLDFYDDAYHALLTLDGCE